MTVYGPSSRVASSHVAVDGGEHSSNPHLVHAARGACVLLRDVVAVRHDACCITQSNATSRKATLHHAKQRCITQGNAASRKATLNHAKQRYITQSNAASLNQRYITQSNAVSRKATLHHSKQRCITQSNATSRKATLHHAKQRYITQSNSAASQLSTHCVYYFINFIRSYYYEGRSQRTDSVRGPATSRPPSWVCGHPGVFTKTNSTQ